MMMLFVVPGACRLLAADSPFGDPAALEKQAKDAWKAAPAVAEKPTTNVLKANPPAPSAAETTFADPAVLEKQAKNARKTKPTISEAPPAAASKDHAPAAPTAESPFADPAALEKQAKDFWKSKPTVPGKQVASRSKVNPPASSAGQNPFTEPVVLEKQAKDARKAGSTVPQNQMAGSRKINPPAPRALATNISRESLNTTLSTTTDAAPKMLAAASPATADKPSKTLAISSEARTSASPKIVAASSPDTADAARKALTALRTATTNASVGNPSPSSSASPDASLDVFTNSMETLDNTYRLAIGDIISFRIVEDEDRPKTLQVTDSGELEVPYIGRYPAEGKTCKQLAYEIKAALEKEYYYQATVIIAVNVKTRSRGKVYLVGAIRRPGPQNIPSDEVFTLSKAILRAGGFTDYADEKHVKVTRKSPTGGKDETFTVNVKDILEEGQMNKDLTLEPEDLVYVPDRLVRF